jgi:3-methylfumaryl-CoA hydratase
MTEKIAEKLDLDHLRQWIGRTEEKTDIVTAHLVAGLRATLFLDVGKPKDGDVAPFTAHWCLTLPVVPMSEIGSDGHSKRGGFLPPVPLPRRMWAGGAISFTEPLRVGDAVTRTSTIKDLAVKEGSTGLLCFVSVDHVFRTPRSASAMTSSIARCPRAGRTRRPQSRRLRLPRQNIRSGILPIPCCCFAIRR